MHLNLTSVQAAMFTPDVSQFSQSSILAKVLRHHSGLYDGEVQALPLPEGFPPDLPRIILQNKSGSLRFQASPRRMDSFWQSIPGKADGDPFTSVTIIERLIQDLESTIRIGRLALVVNRALVHKNPAQLLIDRFCNSEVKTQPFNHSENFEIHNHKSYKPIGFDTAINSWVRCKTGILESSKEKILLVEQDINTTEEEAIKKQFNCTTAQQFFSMARKEIEEILSLYFPPEGT